MAVLCTGIGDAGAFDAEVWFDSPPSCAYHHSQIGAKDRPKFRRDFQRVMGHAMKNEQPSDGQTSGTSASDGSAENQFRDVRLCREWREDLKRLGGFKKNHSTPSASNGATERFVHQIAQKELEADLQNTFDATRAAFCFKRRDIESHGSENGSGGITTPYFSYTVCVSPAPDDPSEVVWRREVNGIREPEIVFGEQFEEAFDRAFDTLELETGETIDVAEVIDRVEDLDSSEVTVSYDRAATSCEITFLGVDAQVRLDRQVFRIRHPRRVTSRQLLESFLEVQQQLVDDQGTSCLRGVGT